MMGVLAAVCLALATYLVATRRLLPTRRPPRPRGPRHPRRPTAWSVTARARTLVGWSPRRYRLTRWISALGVGLGLALWVQDPLVALPYGWIGWELPSLYLELRAARDLARMQRQIALFVGTVHDHLHARGATVEDALMAATAAGPGPLSEPLAQYRRHVEAGWSLAERLAALDRAVNWPSFAFFLSLLALRDETGATGMAHAFDSLQEKLQDDERIQAAIRGELSVYLGVLLLSFALVVGVFPFYRLTSPDWPLYHAHLAMLITVSGFTAAVVFQGLHRFTRAQVVASD
ncbi:MAG: type II secretion system F family protein [Thermaerobacter sp.]|nr:type II secretion system F family protein [Thermaerobacter sp.]